MNSTASLTGSHLRTYQTIYQHPVSHNLGWRDVQAMFRQLGAFETEPNGNWKITRHGHVLVLPVPRTKDVASVEELMTLRHFLEESAAPPTTPSGADADLLVVINHHEARLFRSVAPGAIPQIFLPHPPEDSFRAAPHAKDFSRGREKPDPFSFFAPVAAALTGTGKILVFGGGTGTSNEMDQFIAWLTQHHPPVAARVIGAVVVDAQHQTEPEQLAQARELLANRSTLSR